MFEIIIDSYLNVLLSVGSICLGIFLLGLYVIFGNRRTVELEKIDVVNDLSSIAGDDVIATKLDLARAYIETNNKNLAEDILRLVLDQGSPDQKREAYSLMSLI